MASAASSSHLNGISSSIITSQWHQQQHHISMASAAAAAAVIKSDEKSASRSKTESDEKMMIIDSVSSSSSPAIEKMKRSETESDEKMKRSETESDEKMKIFDSVSSSLLAIENCASISKTESDEKKMMIPDSSRSSLAAAEKTKTERSKIESGCRRSWSDLPLDMVKVILCELPSLCDRIRARAVCKNWLLPLNEIPTSSSSEWLPWLFLFKWDDDTNDIQANLSLCKLVDPSYKEQKSSYFQQLEKMSSIKRKRKRPKSLNQKRYRGTKVCASKNGWVMFYNLSSKKRVRPAAHELKFVQKTSFFLYNPFTKHTITLPDLITPGLVEYYFGFDIATFSSSPDEDDCVFLVVRRDLYNQNHSFYATYCRSSSSIMGQQQQKWKIDQFKVENGNGTSRDDKIKGSVYMDGIFYCVSQHGTLMSFNVALHEWTNLTALCPLPNDKYHSVYLVELNGELLVVCDDRLVQRLYVFDKSSKAWVRRENRYLKDRALALFLGTYGSFAFSLDGAEVANRQEIFYHHFASKCYNQAPMVVRLEFTKLWIQPPSKF